MPGGFGGPKASVVVFLVSRFGVGFVVVVVGVVVLDEEEDPPGCSSSVVGGGASAGGEDALDAEDLSGTGGLSVASSFLYSSSLSVLALPGVFVL